MMIERRLIEWHWVVAEMDCSSPTVEQLQQLRAASRCTQSAGQQKPAPLPAAILASAELSRILKSKIQQAAAALGLSAADQTALFSVDYETRANAWENLQAVAANRAAAAAVKSSTVEAIDNGHRPR